MKKFNRPRASTIGTPVYHRRRRDWKDDRDLLEEVAAVNRLDGRLLRQGSLYLQRKKLKPLESRVMKITKRFFI